MEKVTEKQAFLLKKNGFTDVQINELDKNSASTIISGLKAGSVTLIHKEDPTPAVKSDFKKTTYSSSSYYVSYAKDLFSIMYQSGRYDDADPVAIMKTAVDCIKIAIAELK